MANFLRGEASFKTSDSKQWHLVIDFYAFAVAQQALNLPTLEAMMERLRPVMDDAGKVVRAPDMLALGALLKAGLEERHPDLTEREAVNLLAGGEEVGIALAKAFEGAMPKADPSAEGKAKAPRGTGTKPKKIGRVKA